MRRTEVVVIYKGELRCHVGLLILTRLDKATNAPTPLYVPVN